MGSRHLEGATERIHFIFLPRAMRLALASVEIDLWTAPLARRPDTCTIKEFGTISWFLLPISTLDKLLHY